MAPVCQLLLSFVCCMCTGLVTWLNQMSNTVIRCDTTENILETEWDVETCKINDKFEGWSNRGWSY
jgi:hypothetical protein